MYLENRRTTCCSSVWPQTVSPPHRLA